MHKIKEKKSANSVSERARNLSEPELETEPNRMQLNKRLIEQVLMNQVIQTDYYILV